MSDTAVFTAASDMTAWSQSQRRSGKRIGFVPTMGYLHAGHLSLVEEAKRHADVVVVSIFVNPTQFGPNEDFDKYPRDEQRDLELCREAGVDAVFLPAAEAHSNDAILAQGTQGCGDAEGKNRASHSQKKLCASASLRPLRENPEAPPLYHPGASVFVDESQLQHGLCGARRPGHFRGVCTVVAKLFNIVLPDVAVFGQKDFQQAAIIKRMVRDLNFPVTVIIAPTLREPDGLAMSSRNAYLNAEERQQALGLSRALEAIPGALSTSSATVTAQMREILEQHDLRIDYVEIVDPDTLQPADPVPGNVAIIAAYCGKTRLIDNRVLGVQAEGAGRCRKVSEGIAPLDTSRLLPTPPGTFRLDSIKKYTRAAIAFSGGVDSTYLLYAALQALGPGNVLAVIADTPTLPRRELAKALRIAQALFSACASPAGACLHAPCVSIIHPDEISDPAYAANPPDRCYICKKRIFSAIKKEAAAKGFDVVLDGSNADDLNDLRPGRRALEELGIKSPLAELGITKREIREWSAKAGLPTAQKPAMACLATRIPFGTPITAEALAQIERAEESLHDLGFAHCRVRHHGDTARIEVAEDDIEKVMGVRHQIARAVQAAGYRFAALDLLGYRTGNLN